MKKIITSLSLLCVLLNTNAAHLSNRLVLSARMQGSQMVPAVTTTANGVASFMLNETRDTLQVNVAVAGLYNMITGLHIHEGASGTNGGVILDLTEIVEHNVVRTIVTGSDLMMIKAKMLEGNTYIVAHTAANPGGHLRGQISVEADMLATTTLNGANEVPAVATPAMGVAKIVVSKDSRMLYFNVTTTGLSGPIMGAHIHDGIAGASGGVAEDLSSGISADGKSISGSLTLSYANFVGLLKSNSLYINVHTAAFAGGEIRGQLMLNAGMVLDAMLDVAQIGAPLMVPSNGAGLGNFKLSTGMDTLMYDITAYNLTGAITAAHFHNAPAGTGGGVVHDITPSIMGNRVMGIWTAANGLNAMMLSELMKGNFYIALHTAANAGGELRGQVIRLAREGYVMEINGMQEVPAITTAAMGSGMVTIDRNKENAHYMLAFDGLSGPATGVHFHNGAMGTNGAVIYDLTSLLMNNGAYGYWHSSSMPMFTSTEEALVRMGNVYVNVHTAANPNGEVRGQLMGNYMISSPTVDIIEIEDNFTAISTYPNPAVALFNVQFDSKTSGEASLEIIDMKGRNVLAQKAILFAGFNVVTIDVTTLPTGVYFVKSNNTMLSKLVKLD